MPKPFDTWTVLPHGKLTPINDHVMTVTGEIQMPLTKFSRRMTIVKLDGNRLVIFSPVALDEKQMQQLESLGRPTFLIIPGIHHRMDAKIWKDRYPKIQVIAPAGARKSVEEVVRVDATTADFDDPSVKLISVPGTQDQEAAILVSTADSQLLIVNDIIGHMPTGKGFGGWMLKMMGYAGPKAQIPKYASMTLIRDKAAFRQQLLDWSKMKSLKTIIVSHGDPIVAAPTQTLKELADRL